MKSKLGAICPRSARWSEKLRETRERTDLQRRGHKSKTVVFIFFTCFMNSVPNIKVSIYTSVVHTEQ